MEIKFNCIVLGNQKEKIAEFTEWLDGDGWKHDYYAPLVSNGVFDHRELGDGWFGDIIRRRFADQYDRNGKEVYEGDIMCWPDYEGKKHQTRWLVEWNDKRCGWSDWSPKEKAEVIGNIYENPELLHNK